MAFQKKGKEPEKGKSPDFVVRARQTPDSDFFVNCGAAWKVEVNGKEAISLKLPRCLCNQTAAFFYSNLLRPRSNTTSVDHRRRFSLCKEKGERSP